MLVQQLSLHEVVVILRLLLLPLQWLCYFVDQDAIQSF